MKPFQIFRPGRHTAGNGVTIDFSEADMRAAVAAYDPAVHEAPIVVGHPRDNGPAYGWVGALSFGESGAIDADPVQVDAEFAEMVTAGRFKKRSASWYTPNSANHPLAGTDRHGTYYLRHVGFLGAQPPAIKGLKEVSFGEVDGVIEFSDYEAWGFSSIAGLFRGIREWIIAEKGIDAADKVVPTYAIDSVDSASKAAAEDARKDQQSGAEPAFTEDDTMSQELKDKITALEAENATLKARQMPADFAERETSVANREKAVADAEAALSRASTEARIDAAVKAGRLIPSARKQTIDFAMSLSDSGASIDFGEGDKAEKLTLREAYVRQIEGAPRVIEYGEIGVGSGEPQDGEPISAIERRISEQVAAGGLKK